MKDNHLGGGMGSGGHDRFQKIEGDDCPGAQSDRSPAISVSWLPTLRFTATLTDFQGGVKSDDICGGVGEDQGHPITRVAGRERSARGRSG